MMNKEHQISFAISWTRVVSWVFLLAVTIIGYFINRSLNENTKAQTKTEEAVQDLKEKYAGFSAAVQTAQAEMILQIESNRQNISKNTEDLKKKNEDLIGLRDKIHDMELARQESINLFYAEKLPQIRREWEMQRNKNQTN